MGILVVALGAHREQVGDLVLTPRGVVDAGALAGLLGAGLESTTVDEHGRQPGDDRYLGRRLLVLELLDPPIPTSSSCAPTSWAIRPTCRPLMVISASSARDSAAPSKELLRAAARTILPRIAGEKLCESSRKLGRRGKKIPATGRAMTDGFVVLDRPAANLNGS